MRVLTLVAMSKAHAHSLERLNARLPVELKVAARVIGINKTIVTNIAHRANHSTLNTSITFFNKPSSCLESYMKKHKTRFFI